MNKLKEANANSHPAQRWMFEVWEQPLSNVGNATKVVAGVIAACAWGDSDYAHPSYRSIAEATGQSSKTISKAVKQLEQAGLVVVEKKKSKAGTYNYYRLTFPMGTNDLLSLRGQEDLLSLQGEVAFPMETPCFPYEDDLLYTGKAEALIEASKETIMETTTNDVGWIEENAIEGIQHLFPLDSEASVARVERSWLEKAHQRQQEINAEFAEMMGL